MKVRKRKTAYEAFHFTEVNRRAVENFLEWVKLLPSGFPTITTDEDVRYNSLDITIATIDGHWEEYLVPDWVLVVNNKGDHWIMSLDEYNRKFEEI